jgi:uncharacterized membrane protein
MVLAAVGDGPYNLVLFLHIATVLVAFAPAFVHPLLSAQLERAGRGVAPTALALMHRNGRRVYAPALILTGLLGFALQGMSDGVHSMGETWIWLSILLWIALNGVLHAVLLPAEKAVAGGDLSARGRVNLGGGAMTVLLLVVLALMVFKPGA